MSVRSPPPRQASAKPPSITSPPMSSASSFRSYAKVYPRPGGARHPSNLSGIMSPDSSASGSRRLKQGPPKEPKDDRDWANMEPDEVFCRLPVAEVKRVESKMRADALNKQSELRSMVGTRYRDLLTSASQITSLHSSSLRLSEGLRTVSAACANPTELAESNPDAVEESEDVGTLLPAAAHMKLLLDAPEVLYSYLAHHAHLNAAFLWLVARVVKEGLTAMPDDTKAPYTPLLQKQWETLLPFRGQIVQRATASLRTRDHWDPKALTETLLAVILLDSLPLPDALDLLLSQRLKTLQDILANVPGAKPETRRRRSSSRNLEMTIKELAPRSDDVAKIISEAVKSLIDAVDLVKAVFDSRRKATGEESMLAEAIRLVQAGEEPLPTQPSSQFRRSNHQRRTSRLQSISLPLPPRISLSSHGPPVSTPLVLQGLPSSQILLRYLPAEITSFTPFITPSAAPKLSERLGPWQASAIEILRESVPAWLSGVQSVGDVWKVRSALAEILGDDGFEEQISSALEAEWGARVQTIWTAKLDTLVTDAEAALKDAGAKIRSGQETADNDPEVFTFTDISFPSAAGLTGSSTAFNGFLSTLKKRSSFRTPLLDSVLGGLESAAADIKKDLTGLPESLFDDYRGKLSSALDALVKALGDVLAEAGGHRDATGSVEAELFIGRVALYLGHSSSFLGDLVGVTGVNLDATKSALMDLHSSSTIQWRERTIESATALLYPLFDEHRGADQIRATWQGPYPTAPSPAIISALTHMVHAVRSLGIPTGITLPVVPKLVSAFVDSCHGLEGWKTQEGDAAAQAAADLGFLALIKGEKVEKDDVVQKLLNKLSPSFAEFKTELPSILMESLRRTQLTLYPLLLHLTPVTQLPIKSQRGSDRSAALLRLGAPALANRATGVGAEFKSPIAVARPGKRIGLLSIVA